MKENITKIYGGKLFLRQLKYSIEYSQNKI